VKLALEGITKMKRRQFLQTSTAATCLVGTSALAAVAGQGVEGPDYYEQRTYQVANEAKRQLVSDYLEHAVLPALRRQGIGPVGVFTELGEAATPAIHLLATYRSLEQFAGARLAMESDREYQTAAADYLGTQQKDPAYRRIQSSLMVAFAGMPRLTLPGKEQRVFEWRLYESHNEAKARRKIDMFNEGEIPIFGEAGFTPVLFSETLIGPRVPNLKYMLASPSMEAHEAHWDAFKKHPDWLAMKKLPKYRKTVSTISSTSLAPTEYSEI
jgi:hypothetical protein